MSCQKELKFKKACPFEPLYDNRELSLPKDSKGHCLFHSENLQWKKENNFSAELKHYVALANAESNLDTISFDGCIFVNDSPSEHGIIKIENFKFLKFVDFSFTTFPLTTSIKNNQFIKGFYAHDMNVNNLWISKNQFHSIQIASSLFKNDVTFSANSVTTQFNCLNSKFIGEVSFSQNEFNGFVSLRRLDFRVKKYDQENIEPIYLPVYFNDCSFNNGFRLHECDFEIGFNVDSCRLFKTCEILETKFSKQRAVNFKNVIVNDTLSFVGSAEHKLFNHKVFLDLNVKGKVYFEYADLVFLEEESRRTLLQLEKLGKVNIGKGCIKYKYRTKPKTLIVGGDFQKLIEELMQTFTTFFVHHNGKNLGFEILYQDDEKITFFYYSDQRDISQEQFEDFLQNTEKDLWLLIKNPQAIHVNQESLTENVENIDEDSENEKSLSRITFIEKMLYAKDALVNCMASFFKIGARIQQNKCQEKEVKAFLESIHFGKGELPVNEKVLYQVVINNYNNSQLISINKNNNISIEGNQNKVIQDVSDSDLDL